MVDKAPIGSNPVAVVVVALVGWIAIHLALGLLRQAVVNVDRSKTSAVWEAGDDGAHHHHHHGGSADHAGDDGGHGGNAGGDGGGDGGH